MSDCIFCKIVSKEIPASTLYEDEEILAFKDLEPQGPAHVLVIPKKHIKNLNDTTVEDKDVISRIVVEVIPQLAKDLAVADTGYRVVTNTGAHGGQTVDHLHFHLIGGRTMQWPPG